jgi:hypothetical protein
MTEQGMVIEHENGLCGEGNGKDKIGNENGITRNGSLPLTALISSRDMHTPWLLVAPHIEYF